MNAPLDAIEALRRAVARSKRHAGVPLPPGFIRRSDGEVPTSARLMKSNEIRLKLYLNYAMQATKAPFTFPNRPTSFWATALDLPPETGHRRVNDARKWLLRNQLIKPAELPDGKNGLILLHPDGSGKDWEKSRSGRYISIPLGLWQNGWIIRLSGRALAVLLALLERTGGTDSTSGEMMDGHRRSQYKLSPDTWTRGTQELEGLGVIKTSLRRFGDDEYMVRNRVFYEVVMEAFDNEPEWS